MRRTRGTYGHELGALVVGNVFNLAVILLSILIVMLTVGDSIDGIFAITVTMMGIAIAIPTVTWPMTHTLWMALDLRFRPVDDDESAEAAAWLSSL